MGKFNHAFVKASKVVDMYQRRKHDRCKNSYTMIKCYYIAAERAIHNALSVAKYGKHFKQVESLINQLDN